MTIFLTKLLIYFKEFKEFREFKEFKEFKDFKTIAKSFIIYHLSFSAASFII